KAVPARLVYSAPAQYPSMARQVRAEGEVIITLDVDTSGNVSAARAVSGPPILRSAALDAVKRWKYQPATLGDKPVVSTEVVKLPQSTDQSKPQFLTATVLPGRGMAVLQITAYVPGKGEVEVLAAPSLGDAKDLLDNHDDKFGNKIFTIGGAFLVPYANRIRGKVSSDGNEITTTVAGQT